MKVPFVDLHAQYLTIKEQIDSAIAGVIRDSAYIRGVHVEAFEKAWASTVGVKHCVSCANGTDAIYIAMKGLGIQPGDEVITTAHSWISTSESITQAGGKVVFCDTDARTFTIDPDQLEAKITSRTVGIIPVHLYGQAANLEKISAISRKHHLWVIEDCAQAHLATIGEQTVGTFGDCATFSFYPGKNLGAFGDAGCIVTKDSTLAKWMQTYAQHGGKGEHLMEGINSRLDGLQAAILTAKLPFLKNWTHRRQQIADQYDTGLHGVGDIVSPVRRANGDHVFHLYVIKTKRRDALRKHLTERRIDTVLNYPVALPFLPAYAYLKHELGDFPDAHSNQSQILSLPIFPEMGSNQLNHVIQSVKDFF